MLTTMMVESIFILHISIFKLFDYVSVKPKVIGSPSVKILGEPFDTQLRQFPVATALQLTCEGDVGNDESKVNTKQLWFNYVKKKCAVMGSSQSSIYLFI